MNFNRFQLDWTPKGSFFGTLLTLFVINVSVPSEKQGMLFLKRVRVWREGRDAGSGFWSGSSTDGEGTIARIGIRVIACTCHFNFIIISG